MVTIAHFTTPENAHLARTFLESNDIQSWVLDENHIQNLWWHSQALGGVRLSAVESDADSAIEVLKTTRRDDDQIDIVRGGILLALLGAFIGFPFFLFGRRTIHTAPQ